MESAQPLDSNLVATQMINSESDCTLIDFAKRSANNDDDYDDDNNNNNMLITAIK